MIITIDYDGWSDIIKGLDDFGFNIDFVGYRPTYKEGKWYNRNTEEEKEFQKRAKELAGPVKTYKLNASFE